MGPDLFVKKHGNFRHFSPPQANSAFSSLTSLEQITDNRERWSEDIRNKAC